ncbi:MAG: tryptophan--tRNA ligase [Patescibacteria group bacterium]
MKVLTGIQPTNLLHIGNLFGALLPAVTLQRDNKLLMMVADYHAITVRQDTMVLRDNILFITAAYLAAGIDPKKTILFQQSRVSAHTELGWIMQTQARMGETARMTQFKDKSGGQEDSASVGLFTYPILQAADILLYQTEGVPVGEDQKQHIEFTRDLAERFNKHFGEVFTIPQPLIRKYGARIKALNEPEKKMSKSAPSAKNYISIMDDAEMIGKKIRSAVTDSMPDISLDEKRLGVYNLLTIYHLITEEPMDEIAARYATKGSKFLKDDLAEALTLYLTPLQAEIKGWLKNKDELQKIIKIGSEAAEELAQKTLVEVKKKIGLL